MFWSRSSSAFLSNSLARTTADVVPSPTMSSWVFAISTIIFAAGCSTSISFRIAAPSFVIVMSPRLSISILSMPRGPKVVFSTSPITRAAIMLFLWASLPLLRVVPSLRMRTGCPEFVVVKYAILSFPALIEPCLIFGNMQKPQRKYKLLPLNPSVLFFSTCLDKNSKCMQKPYRGTTHSGQQQTWNQNQPYQSYAVKCRMHDESWWLFMRHLQLPLWQAS